MRKKIINYGSVKPRKYVDSQSEDFCFEFGLHLTLRSQVKIAKFHTLDLFNNFGSL